MDQAVRGKRFTIWPWLLLAVLIPYGLHRASYPTLTGTAFGNEWPLLIRNIVAMGGVIFPIPLSIAIVLIGLLQPAWRGTSETTGSHRLLFERLIPVFAILGAVGCTLLVVLTILLFG